MACCRENDVKRGCRQVSEAWSVGLSAFESDLFRRACGFWALVQVSGLWGSHFSHIACPTLPLYRAPTTTGPAAPRTLL